MKKRYSLVIFTIIVMICSLFINVKANASTRYYITSTIGLNVRTGPGTNYSKTGDVLSYNQEITYKSTTNKTIKLTVRDKVGNEKEQEIEIKQGDLEGPTIEVTNPKDNTWTNEKVTITIKATDYLNEINKITYSTDQLDWKELPVHKEEKTGTATLELEEEQEQTYYIKATDIYGNESDIEETIVKIDLTVPNIKSFIASDEWG